MQGEMTSEIPNRKQLQEELNKIFNAIIAKDKQMEKMEFLEVREAI